MKKSEFKTSFYTLMDEQVECMGLEDKIVFIRKILVDYQKEREDFLDTSNKGKGWSDEQLELILSLAPTKENCAWLARIFKRGYGSIEQIYRWAGSDRNRIEASGRENDAFIQQIKRIAKKVGFRA